MSPHAPYSISVALLGAALDSGSHLTIHIAETPEEAQFLQTGRGPFRTLLEDLGRWDSAWQPPACSPVEWLDRQGALLPRTLLVHAHEVEDGDLDRIAAAGCPVVVCPGTIRWFGRPAPRVPDMLQRGIPVALGTDSRASNESLDMFREMALLRGLCPGLAPDAVLSMATRFGARALDLPVGRLAVGMRLDAVALRAPPAEGEDGITDWVTAGIPPDPIPLLAAKPCSGDPWSL